MARNHLLNAVVVPFSFGVGRRRRDGQGGELAHIPKQGAAAAASSTGEMKTSGKANAAAPADVKAVAESSAARTRSVANTHMSARLDGDRLSKARTVDLRKKCCTHPDRAPSSEHARFKNADGWAG